VTGNQFIIFSASACFVVEREPGKGYQVMSVALPPSGRDAPWPC
jgi:hypothetical protein